MYGRVELYKMFELLRMAELNYGIPLILRGSTFLQVIIIDITIVS